MTCKDVSSAISEMLDRDLPWNKRVRVRLHLALCKVCQMYRDQLVLLKTLAHRLYGIHQDTSDGPVLSEQSKRKIKELIKIQN